MDRIEYLRALYFGIRQMRGSYFYHANYKWRLGTEIIEELKLKDVYSLVRAYEPTYLFGIAVEVDYSNPRNIQLFEDITNEIYIERETSKK